MSRIIEHYEMDCPNCMVTETMLHRFLHFGFFHCKRCGVIGFGSFRRADAPEEDDLIVRKKKNTINEDGDANA